MTGAQEHLGGYHGTSLERAREIETNGFENRDKVLCLTPMDDEGMDRAKDYGRLQAEKAGGNSYGVVEAVFGPQEEVYDAHGQPQIEIPKSEIGSVCVTRVLYFEVIE